MDWRGLTLRRRARKRKGRIKEKRERERAKEKTERELVGGKRQKEAKEDRILSGSGATITVILQP